MRAQLADMRQRPIRNLVSNPRGIAPLSNRWGAYAGASGVGAISARVDGSRSFVRFAWTEATTAVSGGLYIATAAIGRMPVTPGRSYFTSMLVRSSIDQVIRLSADCRDDTDARVGASATIATVTLKANIWRYVSGRFTPPTGADRVSVTIYAADGAGGALWPADATLDATEAIVSQTAGVPVFSDGASPGWKWEGAANGSTSIGYPNLSTLESIAGPPGAALYGLGQLWNTVPGGPFDPITMYFAYHAAGKTAASYPSFAQFGGSELGNGRVTVQCGQTGSDDVRARFDTANGSSNVVVPQLGGRAIVGTHVLVARMPAGLKQAFTSLDGGDESSKSITPGDGIPRTWLNVPGSSTNELTPLWTVVYTADHPASTRDQIISWLRAHP